MAHFQVLIRENSKGICKCRRFARDLICFSFFVEIESVTSFKLVCFDLKLIWKKDLVSLKPGLGLMTNVSVLKHFMVIFCN